MKAVLMLLLCGAVYGEQVLLSTLQYGDNQIVLAEMARLLSSAGHNCMVLYYGQVHPKAAATLDTCTADLVLVHGEVQGSAIKSCEAVLSASNVTDRIRTVPYMIATLYLEDMCLLSMAHMFKMSVIGMIPDPVSATWVLHQAGVPVPLSTVPVLDTLLDTGLLGRLRNTWRWIKFIREVDSSYVSPMRHVLGRYLGEVPQLHDMYKRVSIIFHNAEPAVETPYPVYDFVVRVGTLHCRPPADLPKDVETHMQQFPKGIIYISVDTPQVALSDGTFNEIVLAFKELQYGILWETVPNTTVVPANVMIKTYFADSDVLGHPRTKLFIARCSPSQVHSALFFGVPLICIPSAINEQITSQRISKAAIGMTLDRSNLTGLAHTCRTIIGDTTYRKSARHASEDIRDQPMQSSDRLLYWTEYVFRHKGHTHFRNEDADRMSLVQYYQIDIVALLVVICMLLTVGMVVAAAVGVKYWKLRVKPKIE